MKPRSKACCGGETSASGGGLSGGEGRLLAAPDRAEVRDLLVKGPSDGCAPRTNRQRAQGPLAGPPLPPL